MLLKALKNDSSYSQRGVTEVNQSTTDAHNLHYTTPITELQFFSYCSVFSGDATWQTGWSSVILQESNHPSCSTYPVCSHGGSRLNKVAQMPFSTATSSSSFRGILKEWDGWDVHYDSLRLLWVCPKVSFPLDVSKGHPDQMLVPPQLTWTIATEQMEVLIEVTVPHIKESDWQLCNRIVTYKLRSNLL